MTTRYLLHPIQARPRAWSEAARALAEAVFTRQSRLGRPQTGDAASLTALTVDEVRTEAARCMSCGACFDCENCYKYCQDSAVIRPSASTAASR